MTTATDHKVAPSTTSLIFEIFVLWDLMKCYESLIRWGIQSRDSGAAMANASVWFASIPRKVPRVGQLDLWCVESCWNVVFLCKLLVLRLPCLACQPIHPHIWFCSMKPSNWKPKSLCVPQKVWWLSPVQVRDSRIPGPLCSRNFRNMMIIYDHLFSVLQFWCYQFSWWYPQTTTFFSPTNHLE